MQNKGFVKFLAVALTLICLFYLSFGFVTKYVEDKAAKMGEQEAELYLDSLNSTPFYLGNYTLKDCRETGIGLGLDLKGGMNVILEVSVPEVVKTLADHKTDEAFLKSVSEAAKEAQESQSDFITLFVKAYKKNAPGKPLATIFATQQLKGKVNTNSSDAEVEKVLRESVDEAVDNSFLVLRTRIDRFGVVQPNIQKIEGQSGRIMVELPGIKEPERVRKLLQGSANLEFWETYDAPQVAPYLSQLNAALRNGGVVATDSVQADTTAVAETEQVEEKVDSSKNATSVLAQVNKGDEAAVASKATEAAKKENPLFAMLQPTGAQRGCMVGLAQALDTAEINALLNSEVAKQIFPADLSLKWGVKSMDKAGKIFELYAIRTTGQNGRAPLEGEVVTEAKDEFDQYGNPVVTMKMNTEGARKWAALTEANVNHCVAVVLDNLVYSAPNVMNKIDGGNTQISGNFTTTETKDLANVLQSGKMPAPASIIQEDIVGPTLGAQSIQAGFISCIVAFIVLMLYMVLMYGVREGMVANCALILNFFFTFGILTSLGAALTMSGIAGMVLTLGMAVDANVLIYERTKEEMRSGKNISAAVAAGYSNAFSAIFDSNVTTILTGVILYNFGTGPIKGFATTLIIGIVCSFFTAVWLTRIAYEHFLNRGKWQDLTFTTKFSQNMMKGTKYNFMGNYKKSFVAFGVFLVIVLASFAIRGLSQSIDFTGGRNYKVEFVKQVEPEAVKAAIVKQFEANNKDGEAINVTVIAIGTEGNNVRVSTNFNINDNSSAADAQIESLLYQAFVDGGMVDKTVTEEAFLDRDNRAGGSIVSSQKVGPAIASDILRGAVLSVLFAIVVIFVYILIRFRNVAYSVGSIVALTLDTVLVIGMFSLCYGWIGFSLEVDQTFIGAILTVIGYSINDKVVIFDRIREVFKNYPKRDRQRIFNDALNSTLARTINTSVSTFIVLLVIFVLGGDSIRAFAFAMMLGVIIGTSSSLFIAAPTAYLVMGARIKEDEEPESAN
ncbi:MAG: protein translocase subunit SecDF [Prevotellaceae bacterium]|nr:protein translocase subunit SecDF [Bacteroidaceae bacterium]MCI6803737.1 protein translocase subunit SecDF [Prevotellaceae bacterium]MDD6016260.1 protein translocase subunit SecDF [Prevotellaceae bacterium]